MTPLQFVHDIAAVGYAIGVTLVVLSVVVIALSVRGRRDDGFQAIGPSTPPPPHTSPFRLPRAYGEQLPGEAGEVNK